MRRYAPALLAVTALLAGCVPSVGIRAAGGTGAPQAGRSASPAEPSALETFKAALRKTHAATYRFSVNSDLPDDARVTGTGVFDRAGKKLQTNLKFTGSVNPHTTQSVVIGNHLYQKEPGERRWVHLNMAKLKKKSLWRKISLTDPVGLATFTGAIKTVRQTGPNTYEGTFNPDPIDAGEFLPLGAPSIVVFSILGPDAEFTATTDATGWVTVVNATLTADETVKMTTRFSGHGKAAGIKKPSRTDEAADFYYD